MRVRGSDAEANWSNVAKGAAIVALLSSAQMPAGAMEIVGGLNPAVHMNDGLIQTVVHRAVGGRARGGAHVQGGRQMNVNRNMNAKSPRIMAA